jgi:anti-sigma factor ChrR (cupin superfamily)
MEEHLTPEEVVGLVEGTLESARAAHADVCARCRDEVAELRHIVTEATHETVPEPSPLFWRHQRERVAAEIGVGRPTSATGWHWWGPGVVVGLSV